MLALLFSLTPVTLDLWYFTDTVLMPRSALQGLASNRTSRRLPIPTPAISCCRCTALCDATHSKAAEGGKAVG